MTVVKNQSKDAVSVDPDRLRYSLIGSSAAMSGVRQLIAKVSPSESTVLLLGESGTGKEVVAKAIHAASGRSQGPFIPVNCGAIPSELLESELFGHEKGAFTGAINMRRGRFEMAQSGTLFLDEIGDMPLEMQVKLLRVLQERTFERVGGTKTLQSDVRIVAATHQLLEQKVDSGSFRMDLFYRLNVFPIEVLPLRQRIDDLAELIDHFLQRFESQQGVTIRLMPDALRHLQDYSWPGNVRELSNLLERLTILYPNTDVYAVDLPEKYQSAGLDLPPKPETEGSDGGHNGFVISAKPAQVTDELGGVDWVSRVEDLSALYSTPAFNWAAASNEPQSAHADIQSLPHRTGFSDHVQLDEPIDLKAHLVEVERTLILAALDKTDWVNAQAAKLLGLQRTTLVEKLRKYGLQRALD